MFSKLVHLLMGLSALLLLGGFGGAYHPAGDSLSVFRPYALAGIALALLVYAVRRRRVLAVLALVLLGGGLWSMRTQLASPDPVDGLTLLQSNLYFANDAGQLVDYARQTAPDFITLQEVTTTAIPQLAALRPDYPYQVVCPFSGVGGVAILSRYPFVGPNRQGCTEGLGMVWARVELAEGVVTVVSLHLYWPWPHGQAAQLSRILPALMELEQPVILAGDFNMVPWSTVLASAQTATDTRLIGGLRFTKSLLGGLVQLPIDQVLVPRGWPASAMRGPKLGSDHASVLAEFVFPGPVRTP